MNYGHAPEVVGQFDLDWDEYMHYMYLPILMDPDRDIYPARIRLPERLKFLVPLIEQVMLKEMYLGNEYNYIYVTARRGFACPGDPLNRPDWHCDGFGTDDVNYIWTDAYPTEFAVQEFDDISDDHVRSIEQFNEQAIETPFERHETRTLLRLDPYVVHRAPEIPVPGGERGFIKISVSNNQYNLKGNSHNYLFDYDWKMWDRAELRNDPTYAGGDAGPQS